MAKHIYVSEHLDNVAKLTKREDKINYLKQNNVPELRDILRINFDADIVSLLPEGIPPYRADDAPKGHENLRLNREYRKFQYFFKGPVGSQVQPIKRERMFIDLLESLNADEAEVLALAKDKKLNYKGITGKLVSDAYPGLIRTKITGGRKKKA